MRDHTLPWRAADTGRRMTVSRAQFLKLCSGTLIAANIDPISLVAGGTRALSAASAATPAATSFSVADACAAGFRVHLDSTFLGCAEGSPIRLRLAHVIERFPDPQLVQFSAVFHAETDAPVPEGIYLLQHPVLGQLNLYLAAIGAADKRPAVVEACFNRPAPTSVPNAAVICGDRDGL